MVLDLGAMGRVRGSKRVWERKKGLDYERMKNEREAESFCGEKEEVEELERKWKGEENEER